MIAFRPTSAALLAALVASVSCTDDAKDVRFGSGPVVISEVSCEGDDWVELRNDSDLPVDLTGWALGDSAPGGAGTPEPVAEGTVLEPGQYLVLYRDRDFSFGLSCGKDTVYLFDSTGAVHGSVMLPKLYEGQAWGIGPQHAGGWEITAPTAGTLNRTTPRFKASNAGGDSGPLQLPEGGVCAESNDTLGQLACVDTEVSAAQVEALTVTGSNKVGVARTGKFTVPASTSPGLLPPLMQNATLFAMHDEFLKAAFPVLFGDMSFEVYANLVMRRATRSYFTGSLFVMPEPGSVGFTVAWDPADAGELPTKDEVRYVRDQVAGLLGAGDVFYVPLTSPEILASSGWDGPDLEVKQLAANQESDFRVYTPGTCYGYVRTFNLDGLQHAVAGGLLGWKDLVVVTEAPTDLEEVVAGIVTGTEQTELSHLAVRTERRGTPNIYQKQSLVHFSGHEGKLVKLEAFSDGYVVVPGVTLEEAETFWAASRPKLSLEGTVDAGYKAAPALQEVPVSTPGQRLAARKRFGSKGANLAAAAGMAVAVDTPDGFLVPFHWYLRFMEENRLVADGRTVSYAEYVGELQSDPELAEDPLKLKQALAELQAEASSHAVVPAGLEDVLRARITEVFGSDTAMVRFRSSSNAEDLVGFPGAGLYSSRSACAADSTDGDEELPSRCDPNTAEERTLRDALVIVWMSAWNYEAFREREYYQMDQRQVAMGIAVTRRFAREQSNGLLTVGVGGDQVECLVNAQWGGVSVVFPEPGVQAEAVRLLLGDDGIRSLLRQGRSSLLADDEVVLPEARVDALAAAAWNLSRHFPVDEGDGAGLVKLEVEWKFDEEGNLRVKQVRPLLDKGEIAPDGLLLAGEDPQDLCSTFVDDRSVWREREIRSRVTLDPLTVLLPFDPAAYPIEAVWVDRLLLGPDGAEAVPAGPGVFQLEKQTGWEDVYRFSYVQPFTVKGKPVSLEWNNVETVPSGSVPAGRLLGVSGALAGMRACLGPCDDPNFRVEYADCAMDELETWQHVVDLSQQNGDLSRITIRMKHEEDPVESGPIRLRYVDVERRDGTAFRIDQFFRMADSSLRHNRSEDFLFDLAGELGAGVYLLVDEPDLWEPQAVRVTVFDQDFDTLFEAETDAFWCGLAEATP